MSREPAFLLGPVASAVAALNQGLTCKQAWQRYKRSAGGLPCMTWSEWRETFGKYFEANT